MIGALANLGLGAYQLYQAYQAKQDAGERPNYQTPEAINQMIQSARVQAGHGLEGKSEMINRILGNEAGTIGQLKQVGQGASTMGAINDMHADTLNKITDIGIADSQKKQDNQAILRQALEMKGKFQDQEWNYNKRLPYQEGMDDYANLLNSGIGNLGNAAGGLDNTLGSLASALGWGTDTALGKYYTDRNKQKQGN